MIYRFAKNGLQMNAARFFVSVYCPALWTDRCEFFRRTGIFHGFCQTGPAPVLQGSNVINPIIRLLLR